MLAGALASDDFSLQLFDVPGMVAEPGMPGFRVIKELPKIGGTLVWGPYSKDPTI